MTSASLAPSRFLIPIAVVVMAGVACNTANRRAEKAMAVCVEMEDKLFMALSTVWAEDLKKDPKPLEDLRIQFRESRLRMRTEASGDALVLRCADYLGGLNAGAASARDSMTKSIALRLGSPEAAHMGTEAFIAAEKAKQAPLVAYQQELESAKRQVLGLIPGK